MTLKVLYELSIRINKQLNFFRKLEIWPLTKTSAQTTKKLKVIKNWILVAKRSKKGNIQKWPQISSYSLNPKLWAFYFLFFIADELARMRSLFFSLRGLVITLPQRAPKARVAQMGGWVGTWVVNKRVLRFCSISGIITSKLRWFQVWPLKLSTAIRSKVMRNLDLKYRNFNADSRGGKQL